MLPRNQTYAARLDSSASGLAERGTLTASIRVPDAIGPLTVEADLRTRKVLTSVALEAPGDGRPLTRANWMLRQLKDAPAGLLIETSFVNARGTSACLLSDAREDASRILSSDPKRPPRAFRLVLSRPMGTKRGRGERSFVRDTKQQAIDFYRLLVQDLRPWRASAPKLPDEPAAAPKTATSEPPLFTADEREPSEAAAPTVTAE